MNRIDTTFARLKEQKKKALITFITAGDGGLDTTEQLVYSMERGGADIIELGIPFSDPIAEGPTIQKASVRALENGTRLVDVFALVRRLRKNIQLPLVMMMYVNSIFGFGTQRFFALCRECGVDGVIVPDLPYEEKEELQDFADREGVYVIRLVTPASHERIRMIANGARGFLYCVSSVGVTGVRESYSTDFKEFFGAVNRSREIPAAVGFGISGPEQAKAMKHYCDGVIVGSAVVELVERHGAASPGPVETFTRSLREALDT